MRSRSSQHCLPESIGLVWQGTSLARLVSTCRQLQGENKIRGYVTITTTSSTICTAFLLWKFKPQVIKVRGELAQTLVKFGKSVGNTMKLTKKVILDDAIAASDKVRACHNPVAGVVLHRVLQLAMAEPGQGLAQARAMMNLGQTPCSNQH